MTAAPRRWSILIFVLLLSIYVSTTSGHHYSIDGMAMYQQSKTLLFQHTFRFSPPFVWGDYRSEFTYWAEGLSFVYIVPLAVWAYLLDPGNKLLRTVPSNDRTLLFFDPGYAHVNVTNCVLTALTAVVLFNIAIRLGIRHRAALVLTLVYGLASPAFAYQKMDFAQPLAAFLMTLTILLFILAADLRERAAKYWLLVAAGLSLGLLSMTRSETQLVVVPVFAASLAFELRRPRWRERITAAAALLLPLLSIAVMHAAINHLKSGSLLGEQASRFTSVKDTQALLRAFAGLFISPGRGLLIFFPLAIYAPAGWYRMFAEKPQARWAVLFGSLIVLHVVLYSLWSEWWAGISWGPRFLVPTLPILTLLAFWPSGTRLSSSRRPLPLLIKAEVVAFGFVMTLTGVLLRWNVIEGQHDVQAGTQLWKAAYGGIWYFRLAANPLWTNLQDLWHPHVYDLLILEPASRQIIVENFVVALSVATLIAAAVKLIRSSGSRGNKSAVQN